MLKIIRSLNIPAQLTNISSFPKLSIAQSIICFDDWNSETESEFAIALPPFSLIYSTTSSAGCLEFPEPSKLEPKSFTTIEAPSLAINSATAFPIPLPAPVIIATLPSSLFISYFSFFCY